MAEDFSRARTILEDALVEDSDNGVYRVRRSVFTDEELFELEMKQIFEGNGVYLAHESQIPQVGDYFTTYIGRQPVVISRDKQGVLHCLINACGHRGATLCRRKTDNRTTFTCPFHGWTFDNSGKLLKVKDPREAGYPEQFNTDGWHDLKKVARFESYRGFLFGSHRPDAKPQREHLGDAAVVIDMVVDQSPEGPEVLRGTSSLYYYYYDGNWKLQAENGADGYHVSATHWNYAVAQAPTPWCAHSGRRRAGWWISDAEPRPGKPTTPRTSPHPDPMQ
ncbi:Rieske 2Fe-2S domain-containing protein [Streptomyces sp. NPDC056309]|uniref:Rieske 2Fe-2S domain-containing protein n=1 Tax=unclassified Streptomyces TaxID=2593676 RepID=UPI0035D944B8